MQRWHPTVRGLRGGMGVISRPGGSAVVGRTPWNELQAAVGASDAFRAAKRETGLLRLHHNGVVFSH